MRLSQFPALMLCSSLVTSTAFAEHAPFTKKLLECNSQLSESQCISKEACKWLEEESSCILDETGASRIFAPRDEGEEIASLLGGFIGLGILLAAVAFQ